MLEIFVRNIGFVDKAVSLLPFVVSFAWLSITFFYLLREKRLTIGFVSIGIIVLLVVSVAKAIFQTVLTYYTWSANSVSQFFLPPHDSFYFYQYSFFHYWFAFFLGIIGSLIIGFLLFLIKDRLEEGDIKIALLGGLANGWPNVIIYLALIIIFVLFDGLVVKKLIKKAKGDEGRVGLTYSLVIASLASLVLGNFISKYIGFNVLKV